MRVKKTTPAGTVLYGWDNDRIFAEYDDTGSVIQETVYFGSTPVALLKGGNTYRIFADQIDTPRVLADNANTALWAWDSKPFGESVPDEDADKDGTSLSYNLRFPGQYYDVESQKHYNFNRDYNPVTGRYVQNDPIGLDGGLNTFGYVDGNPIINVDFNGLIKCSCRQNGNTGGYGTGYDRGDGKGKNKNMKICQYSCSYNGKSVLIRAGSFNFDGYNCYGAYFGTTYMNGHFANFARGFDAFTVDTEPSWWTRKFGSTYETDYTMHKILEANFK